MANYNFTAKQVSPAKWDKDWFKKELRKERKRYLAELKKGSTDPGYAWAFTKLAVFLEGVFTLKSTPLELSLEIPKGEVRLTVPDGRHWIVRNDYSGSVGVIDVEELFKWAVKTYPEGIGGDGYELIALQILTQGCDEEQSAEIYDKTFLVAA